MNTIGSRIKSLRKQIKLTQQGLADSLKAMGAEVNRVSVSRWESDIFAPNAWSTKCMAELFGVTMDYLMDGIMLVNQPNTPNERAILEAVRLNPQIAHIIDCAKNMTPEQIELACRIVCSIIDRDEKAN